MDETEVFLPPRLTLQIWDNDSFSPDEYLGNNMDVHLTMAMGVCIWLHPFHTGTIELNLLRMPNGRKTSERCDLDQLLENVQEEEEEEQRGKRKSHRKRFVDLFEKKRVKGWWPAVGEDEEGKKIIAVSCCWQDKYIM